MDERFFKTVQSQFEAEVRATTQTLSLTELNRAFAAWLNSAYHQQVHRETNQTPHERYFTEDKIFRPVAIDSLLPIFHLCEYRIVESTFSDVVLKNTFYQVDLKLRGLRLRVHFDPFVDETGMPATVELYSEQGVFLGVGRRYERQRGSHEQPKATTPDKLEKSAYRRRDLSTSGTRTSLELEESNDGVILFVCPECRESQTSVNPKTNLARCFCCERNWNPIDFTMVVGQMDFLEAYGFLEEMLPRSPELDDRPF